jgi:hypothetical protein
MLSDWLFAIPTPHFQDNVLPIAPLLFSRYFKVMPPGDLRKGLGAFALCGQLTSQPDMLLLDAKYSEVISHLCPSLSLDL